MTWNNQPAIGYPFETKTYSPIWSETEPVVLRVDVSTLVNLWATGVFTPTSLALMPGDERLDFNFFSRETAQATAPGGALLSSGRATATSGSGPERPPAGRDRAADRTIERRRRPSSWGKRRGAICNVRHHDRRLTEPTRSAGRCGSPRSIPTCCG